MTIGVAISLGSEGAVLACDSRITEGSSIFVDDCQKWLVTGSVVSVVAGKDGGLMDAIRGVKNFQELHTAAMDYTHGRDLNWCLLSYDRPSSQLVYLDSDGLLQPLGRQGAIGCGSATAKGVLAVSKAPRSLEQAAKVARKACEVTCQHDVLCGGKINVVVVPPGRKKKPYLV